MTTSAQPGPIRLGTERIVPLLEAIGSPQRSFPVIHIAGTNSKGTTSAVLDALLTSLGFLTARFNSPHLRYARDSCRIGGAIVDERTWHAASQRVLLANDGIAASDFEQLFARFLAACSLRPDFRPQVLIVECGMGGKTDATNVFPKDNVLASVVTPIGLDHKSFLGDSLYQIAEQKMGIAKPGGLIVIADQRNHEALSLHRSHLPTQPTQRQLHEPLTGWGPDDDGVTTLGRQGSEIMMTIRRQAETLKARLVRCSAPHLHTARISAVVSTEQTRRPWQMLVQYNSLLPPILQAGDDATGDFVHVAFGDERGDSHLASTLFTNATFRASQGQAPLLTPLLPALPPTRAATSAVSTALATLYAIASDEPPSARQLSGFDPHEDVRLQLAWSLRDCGLMSGDRGALGTGFSDALVAGVQNWEGRGSWVDAALPSAPIVEQADSMDMDEVSAATAPRPLRPLHLLVDGAHNVHALTALFEHIRSLLIHHRRRIDATAVNRYHVRVSVILAFSSSKESDGDLDELLGLLAALPTLLSSSGNLAGDEDCVMSELTAELSLSNVPNQPVTMGVTVDVHFTEFETPIEGMPWVKPLAADRLAQQLRDIVQQNGQGIRSSSNGRIGQISGDPDLPAALTRVAATLNGRPGTDGQEHSLSVLTGSLYLVGQLYRLLEA